MNESKLSHKVEDVLDEGRNKLSQVESAFIEGKQKITNKVQHVVDEGRISRKHQEGPVARTLEQQTAKLPSDTYLWAAVGAMGLSLFLEFTDRKRSGNFVATWVPTILTIGLYNKMVKLHGSDPE